MNLFCNWLPRDFINKIIICIVNRSDSMSHWDWSWKYWVPKMFTPQLFVLISYKQPECLMMFTQGKEFSLKFEQNIIVLFLRWVPTLDSNTVADRIISGVSKNHKYVIVPEYFRFMLILKWIFPWPCNSGFLRRLVLDAAPQHLTISPTLQKCENGLLTSSSPSSSSSSATPTVNTNGTTKPNQILVQRTVSTGERVL